MTLVKAMMTMSLVAAAYHYVGLHAAVSAFFVTSHLPWRLIIVRIAVVAFLNMIWFAPSTAISVIHFMQGFQQGLMQGFSIPSMQRTLIDAVNNIDAVSFNRMVNDIYAKIVGVKLYA